MKHLFETAICGSVLCACVLAQPVKDPAGGGASSVTSVSVKEYGAKGDGVTGLSGAAISQASTTLTIVSASFRASDVGKTVSIAGAGALVAGTGYGSYNNNLIATIGKVFDANRVELSRPAMASVGNAAWAYGTDDHASIKTAVSTAIAKAINLSFPSSSQAGTYYLYDNSSGPLTFEDFSGTVTFESGARVIFPDIDANGLMVNATAHSAHSNGVYSGVRIGYWPAPLVRNDHWSVFQLHKTVDTKWTNLHVDNSIAGCVDITGAVRAHFYNATLEHCMADGLLSANSDALEIEGTHVENNGDDGISLISNDNSGYKGGKIINSTIINSGSRGIAVLGVSDVLVSQFVIRNTRATGIACEYDASVHSHNPENVHFENGVISGIGGNSNRFVVVSAVSDGSSTRITTASPHNLYAGVSRVSFSGMTGGWSALNYTPATPTYAIASTPTPTSFLIAKDSSTFGSYAASSGSMAKLFGNLAFIEAGSNTTGTTSCYFSHIRATGDAYGRGVNSGYSGKAAYTLEFEDVHVGEISKQDADGYNLQAATVKISNSSASKVAGYGVKITNTQNVRAVSIRTSDVCENATFSPRRALWFSSNVNVQVDGIQIEDGSGQPILVGEANNSGQVSFTNIVSHTTGPFRVARNSKSSGSH